MGRRKLVVKVGTGYLFGEIIKSNQLKGYFLRKDQLDGLAEEIDEIYKEYDVILVSSGAIGKWAQKKRLSEIPNGIDEKARFSGKGQHLLMMEYMWRFEKYGRDCVQCLLTYDDLKEERKENLIKIISDSFESGDVVICNENDLVTQSEIYTKEYGFGDNDILAAYLGAAIKADLVFMLSNGARSLGAGGKKSKEKAREILREEDIGLKIINSKYKQNTKKDETYYQPNIRRVLKNYFN